MVFCSSELTKDQMVLDLAVSTKTLLWSGIVLGLTSVGILGYAVVRYSSFSLMYIYPWMFNSLPYFLFAYCQSNIFLQSCYISNFTIQLYDFTLACSVYVKIKHTQYIVFRNWNKWKQWRQQSQRQLPQPSYDAYDDDLEYLEETEVMDNELCVICLMRRRRSAFTPCGHLVCCPRCAQLVESASHAKCPVCCQKIRSSLRIYG